MSKNDPALHPDFFLQIILAFLEAKGSQRADLSDAEETGNELCELFQEDLLPSQQALSSRALPQDDRAIAVARDDALTKQLY